MHTNESLDRPYDETPLPPPPFLTCSLTDNQAIFSVKTNYRESNCHSVGNTEKVNLLVGSFHMCCNVILIFRSSARATRTAVHPFLCKLAWEDCSSCSRSGVQLNDDSTTCNPSTLMANKKSIQELAASRSPPNLDELLPDNLIILDLRNGVLCTNCILNVRKEKPVTKTSQDWSQMKSEVPH